MSRCFTWFPIVGYRRTQYIPELGLFYKNVGSLWKVSDCEEIDMCIVVSGTCPTCVIEKVWE